MWPEVQKPVLALRAHWAVGRPGTPGVGAPSAGGPGGYSSPAWRPPEGAAVPLPRREGTDGVVAQPWEGSTCH